MLTSPASDADQTDRLAHVVTAARGEGLKLRIVGGDTRAFYGRKVAAEPLALGGHRGVVAYDPSELVITARAGTPMIEIEALLAANGQMLTFEPPVFAAASTIGGTVAAGLSGSRRPFAGALRDYVLGAKILDGRGEVLNFGGTVFKNVAGFDAFRLMAGALGCLGVILEVSIRVTPRPRAETALAFELTSEAARMRVVELMRRPLPLSGAFHDGESLHLRLSGGEAAVRETARELGGEAETDEIWTALRDLSHPAFDGPALWRLSLPQTAQLPRLDGHLAWDWGGSQRWLAADSVDTTIWDATAAAGGHATLFRGGVDQVFQPLPAPLLALHKRVKAALDPDGLFNPGRMYEGL
ncbi:glycolate oxidase subunit GlcE [Phenylobacterium sp.]|uniref:glycolate oxidase subunit GlcE n=1 Tax=Phenylobacterium sp. TaxID=1871053 RepID=UPI0027345D15|nr:glycolate oxidase subunit GlcE [Phenylobacterium sp.]MDP3852906.1 glycolate oxidase subunit GlcE [Phenylobacterium sp.]